MSAEKTDQRIETIKQIRIRTGLGLRECIELYDRGGGSLQSALDLAKTNGVEISNRLRDAGIMPTRRLHSYVHGGRIAALVEMGATTDFAANTPNFGDLAKETCLQIVGTNCGSVEELMSSEYVRDPSRKFRSVVDETMAVLRENIGVIRFVRYEVGDGEHFCSDWSQVR